MPSAKSCWNPFFTKFCRILQKSVTSALWCNSPTKQSTCPRYKIVPCRQTKHTNVPNILGWNLHSSIRYIHWKHYLKNSYSIGDDIMSLLRRTDIQEHQVLRPPSAPREMNMQREKQLTFVVKYGSKWQQTSPYERRQSEYSCSTICPSQGPHESIVKLL